MIATKRGSVVLAYGVLAGCSAGLYEVNECSQNADCRGSFGLGSVCNDEGFCETARIHPRCVTSFPELRLPVDPDETFLFATLFDHSIDTHVARYRSAELAAAQVNDNGGLANRSFSVIHCTNEEEFPADTLDKDMATVEVAGWLAESLGVPAIVGPAASSRTEAAFNRVVGSGTLIVSPSATSPTLTDLDGVSNSDASPGLLWRTAPPDSLQGQAIADDMVARGVSEVSVVHQTGAYGEGLAAVFIDAFVEAGGSASPFPYSSETERSEALTNVAQLEPEEVLFISSDIADVVTFVNTANTLDGYAASGLFLTDAARTAEVLEMTTDATDVYPRIRGSAPSLPSGQVYDAFTSGYLGRFSEDVSQFSFTAHAFDASWLVIYGTAWAWHRHGSVSGANIARGLRRLSAGEPYLVRPSSWNSIEARLRDGISVDIEGASGPLRYDEVTEETEAPIDIWFIDPDQDDFAVDHVWP